MDPFFLSYFTQMMIDQHKMLPVVSEEILIQKFLTIYGC